MLQNIFFIHFNQLPLCNDNILIVTAQYADGNSVSPTLKNTSEIISFFDDIFDSVNGARLCDKKSKGKFLRQAVTENSKHHQFWEEALIKLNTIKFIDSKGKETSVPSLKNWLTSIKSYQRLWQLFKSKNIKIMRPRYFNSDPIENFFGQIRAYNFRYNNPNCHTFKSTFKSLLITRFIKFHSENFNCEEDSGEQVLKLKTFFNKVSDNLVENVSPESSEVCTYRNIHTTEAQERLDLHSRAYTTGWVIRKLFSKINCQQCRKKLTIDKENLSMASVNNYISFKEYKAINLKKLTYPSVQAVRVFGDIIKKSNKYLEEQPQKKNLSIFLKNYIQPKCLFDFLDCDLHRDAVSEYFVGLSLRLTIFNWCNVINKILKGTDVSRLDRILELPKMQLKAFNKYKTRIKNKKK